VKAMKEKRDGLGSQPNLEQLILSERRRCAKVIENVLNEDRKQFRNAVANMKTDDPKHNQALDKVIKALDNVIEE
jgi:hypothetical protein